MIWRAAALAMIGTTSALAQRSAMLRGSVLSDSADRPLAGAAVTIPAYNISALSDSTGTFRLGAIPVGRTIVWVRRFGFAPVSSVLTFTAGDTLERDFVLQRTTTALPSVRVNAPPPVPAKFREFERRRKSGFGHFMTRAEIAQMETRKLADILELLPGSNIQRVNSGSAAYVSGPRTGGGGAHACYAAIVIDGVIVYDGKGPLFDINIIGPQQLGGIEYYSGPATIPGEYRSTRAGCGMVILWTR